MKIGYLSAAALLTVLPGAALADSAIYTAVYSPVLDVTTRSCEITRTGVQGDVLNGRGLNTQINSNNTAVMRTITSEAGTAKSTAGIQFDMVGANIVTISEATMSAIDREAGEGELVINRNATANTNGTIKVNLPNARVDIKQALARDLGFVESPAKGQTVAQVNFTNGQPNVGGSESDKVGSIVVGQRRGGNRLINNPALEELENDRSSGRRTGTVNFTLTGIDRNTPTTLMQATISCEPVPVAERTGGFIKAVIGSKTGGGNQGGPGLSCDEDPNCG